MTPTGSVPVLEPLPLVRIVSTPDALDAAAFRTDDLVLRVAPDEVLIVGDGSADGYVVEDRHAIIVQDAGWHGAWMTPDDVERLLRGNCSWKPPTARPTLAQGRVANAPVKLWLEDDRVLLLVPHVAAHDLAERMRHE